MHLVDINFCIQFYYAAKLLVFHHKHTQCIFSRNSIWVKNGDVRKEICHLKSDGRVHKEYDWVFERDCSFWCTELIQKSFWPLLQLCISILTDKHHLSMVRFLLWNVFQPWICENNCHTNNSPKLSVLNTNLCASHCCMTLQPHTTQSSRFLEFKRSSASFVKNVLLTLLSMSRAF